MRLLPALERCNLQALIGRMVCPPAAMSGNGSPCGRTAHAGNSESHNNRPTVGRELHRRNYGFARSTKEAV